MIILGINVIYPEQSLILIRVQVEI